MQKQFEEYLLTNGYKSLTAQDYSGRVERLARKEKITLEDLAKHIAEIMPEYERTGKKSSYGKRSHSSVLNALKRFAEFLAEANVQPENAN